MTNAGSSIRKLAQKRRRKAVKNFLIAGALFAAPFLSYSVLGAIGIALLIHIGCWITGAIFSRKGKALLSASQRADRGAAAEESVANTLSVLTDEGWSIEYNIPMRYWGDADAFLCSPDKNHFVIDTKSNRGRVFFDGTKLMLSQGRRSYPFSGGKDILKAMRGQAASMRSMRRVRFVNAILCFTQAELDSSIAGQKIENVHISTQHSLVQMLKTLDR